MINLDYPDILDLFSEYLDPKRTESAAFLIWYLENYYRLDSLEAVDSVCDQRGDKGSCGDNKRKRSVLVGMHWVSPLRDLASPTSRDLASFGFGAPGHPSRALNVTS